MGALALLDDERYVTVIPERFRFSDENPLTLEPFGRNKFGDLPPYIEDVITDVIGLTEAKWEALVDAGETYTVVGPFQYYTLAPFLRAVANRVGRQAPAGVCPDCWGTGAMCDEDGSMTGRVGGAVLCGCVGGWA
ncbi:hypothetical protein H4696_006139 [Amycolatopsis lexingtonensis]|uniref:Uncharacterized protein n=1 Tax=Amycolatopsis lexingtonensis TaxID=218822 RepID=A0ABR9I776_9PSEU|nr:hypothetical protein [Amycolatopsis lexingtonensis]MBE1499039.1 hypothetical protein [Amycolatopsis lexingtonensis]